MAGLDEIFSSRSEDIRKSIEKDEMRRKEALRKEVIQNDDFKRTLKNQERQYADKSRENVTQQTKQSANVFDLSKKTRVNPKKSFEKDKKEESSLEEESIDTVFSSEEELEEFDSLHQKIATKQQKKEMEEVREDSTENLQEKIGKETSRAVKDKKEGEKEIKPDTEKGSKEIEEKTPSILPIWSEEEDLSLSEKTKETPAGAKEGEKAKSTSAKGAKPGPIEEQSIGQADARNIPSGYVDTHRIVKEDDKNISTKSSSEDRQKTSRVKKQKSKTVDVDPVSGQGREFRGIGSPLSQEGPTVELNVRTPEQSKEAASLIQDLANQMIEQIQIMEKGNETHTQITLRSPSLLQGATITLTSYSTARGEYNISFANLSSAGKTFLDKNLKEHSLAEALKKKGIITHRITTTTEKIM